MSIPWAKRKLPKKNLDLVKLASKFDCSPRHGYNGYLLYFPEDSSNQSEEVLKCVVQFRTFIEENISVYDLTAIETQKWFHVDYKLLTKWFNLKSNTEFYLNCMGLAMHQTIINSRTGPNLPIILPRLMNYEPVQAVKDIGVDFFGQLVSVRGTVIKATIKKLIVQYMPFSCSTCTGVQVLKQNAGNYTIPNSCPTEGCRARSDFNPLAESQYTRRINFQKTRIQEIPGADQCESGRIPRTLDCEMTEDLVNCCIPGDDVTMTGIIKARTVSEKTWKNKMNQQSGVSTIYLDVISVVNNKNQSQGSYGASERIIFNMNDFHAIKAIRAEPQIFRLLVQSLCPQIYGHERVKAGLLLALFGGTKSELGRAESHVLVVGDPGLGKSQMLQACTNVTPRGVYVCGNTSTGSGLTVTMVRKVAGEFSLEAGALMLANQGCCCIDEFDKMSSQHANLLEAMEQQTISIAKGGIVCTLPTKATILAAANPIGGHYNKAKSVAENLKMGSMMLSRFDLIFILLDKPNEELDQKLLQHVLGYHSGKTVPNHSYSSHTTSEAENTLTGRLAVKPNEEIDHLPHVLFRKYIAYAHQYVNPELSQEAKDILKDYYFKLRTKFRNGNCTPITTRQLMSLIRLTQARAKIELRETATKQDALDVVEIMEESLIDVFTNDVGNLDTTRSQYGSGMSSKNQVMKLLEAMQNKCETETTSILETKEIRKLSEEVGIASVKFFTVLDTLNNQGFILSKGQNRYQVVTAVL